MAIEKTAEVTNLLNDGIGFVESWDFSVANLSEKNRIQAITQVASICYQNPKGLGSESLYNRLMAESMGLPSSSFEFVPVLLDKENPDHAEIIDLEQCNARKFGELVEGGRYLLTNFRALVYDYEHNEKAYSGDIRKIFNTEKECEIIKKHFNVFLYKVDLPTRSQMVRHRIAWQELSRRYVSGDRVPFEFYISEKMNRDFKTDGFNTADLLDLCARHYHNALENGVKPEEARRMIPQAAYSQIWGGFMPNQLENFFKLRLDSHAQVEIRKVAEAMSELTGRSAPDVFVKEDGLEEMPVAHP
jgi:thymidylate synthase (FAD)